MPQVLNEFAHFEIIVDEADFVESDAFYAVGYVDVEDYVEFIDMDELNEIVHFEIIVVVNDFIESVAAMEESSQMVVVAKKSILLSVVAEEPNEIYLFEIIAVVELFVVRNSVIGTLSAF